MSRALDTLNIEMNDIRGIKHLSVNLNFVPGVYAITGENASGKSTLLAALSGLFYPKIFSSFLITKEKSYITYNYGEAKMRIAKRSMNRWGESWSDIKINGFYEGSIIHGNRFRDVTYQSLFQSRKVNREKLSPASEFVKKNLGFIIRKDENYYENLFYLPKKDANSDFSFKGTPYFLLIDAQNNLYPVDEIVSQYSLSTGENLIISLLHSIHQHVVKKSKNRGTYVVILDEIEMGLHPSALNRLFKFLKSLAEDYGVIIYLSTHSMEVIRNIEPNNIYFLQKKNDALVEVVNPCFPAYATRDIYQHDGYDLLILVEDKLAKMLIRDMLIQGGLNLNKLIHILPVGGWENVLSLHEEVLKSNLLGSDARAISILDGDVKDDVESKYRSKGIYKNLNVAFLPIESLEKYLHEKIIITADDKFIQLLGDNLFTKTSLLEIIDQYSEDDRNNKDSSGKKLLRKLVKELQVIDRTEDDLIRMVSNYIITTDSERVQTLIERIKES
jgi:predicted ATPase